MNPVSPISYLSVIIPCYNESDRLELMFEGIDNFIKSWKAKLEVIIVNDGSKDNFYELAKQHSVYLANTNIIKIINQENTGKGGALKHGVDQAKGDFMLTLDADMASPPAELFTWFKLLNGALKEDTIYIGSREHRDSVITKQNNRKIIGSIFNLIVRTFTPLKAKDTQCGFKLYPAAIARKLFKELKTYGWAHDVELLYKASLNKINIIEMPLVWNAVDGSKINVIGDGIKMMAEVIKIISITRRQNNI
jgi:dolichyl-phosphate beta-glucosyltransferase